MKSLYFSLACLALLVGLTSCPKIANEVPVPNRGASSAFGTLSFLNEFQKDAIVPGTVSGITIKAVGTSGEYTAEYSIANFTYTFSSLPAGTYSITYTADGFATIINPKYEHPGGDVKDLGNTYVYKPSTTVIDSLKAKNTIETVTKYYYLPIDLQANESYKAVDSVKVLGGTPANQTYTGFFYTDTTVISFPIFTSILQRKRIDIVTKNVAIRVRLNDSTASAPLSPTLNRRGFQLYFSDTENPGPTNYKYTVTSDPTIVGAIFQLNFDLQQLISAGFTSGQTVNIGAYGLSGDKNWYGTQVNAEAPTYIRIPGLNLTAGQGQSTTLVLP
jgi:hypothetical protein